jgi:hypothetical protein
MDVAQGIGLRSTNFHGASRNPAVEHLVDPARTAGSPRAVFPKPVLGGSRQHAMDNPFGPLCQHRADRTNGIEE